MAEEQEGIEALPNGTIRMWLDGPKHQTVRRPKLGELRQIEELLTEAEREREDSLAGRRAEIEELRLPEGEEIPAQDLAERQRRLREIQRITEATRDTALLGWFRDAMTVLGAKLPDSDDDLPAWVLDPKLPARLLSQWRTSPFRSVARN